MSEDIERYLLHYSTLGVGTHHRCGPRWHRSPEERKRAHRGNYR